MSDATVIYYTSNHERASFEGRIIRSLLHASRGLPVISVSQKPISLGHNICVGKVGRSARNAWRQFLIGCKAATTRFVIPAESDMIFPSEHFQFVPPRDDTFYTSIPVYVLFAQRGKSKVFCLKPRGTESAMVVGREYAIERVENMLKGGPEWRNMETAKEMDAFPYLFTRGDKMRRENRELQTAIISIKTDQNMHRKTPHSRDGNGRFLPGHGTPIDIIRKYMR